MSRSQVDALKREFMALLQHHVTQPDGSASEVPACLVQSLDNSNHN
jgi:hypothetical protein